MLRKRLEDQTDNKIIVAGTTQLALSGDFSTIRLLSSGAFDTSFDGDGIAVTSVSAGRNAVKIAKFQSVRFRKVPV